MLHYLLAGLFGLGAHQGFYALLIWLQPVFRMGEWVGGPWLVAAPTVSAALCLLALATEDPKRPRWLTGSAVAALCWLPVLGAMGNLLGDFGHLLLENSYRSPLDAVPGLLESLPLLFSPLASTILAVPGAVLLLAWLRHGPCALLRTGCCLALVALWVALMHWRCEALSEVALRLRGADPASGLSQSWPSAIWPFLACLAALGGAVLSLQSGRWLLAAPWLVAGLGTLDTTPLMLRQAFPAPEIDDPQALPILAGNLPTATGLLLDLTGGSLRVDQTVVPASALADHLVSLGYPDMGEDFPRPQQVDVPWQEVPRSGALVSPPASSSCGALAPVMDEVLRHGMTIWLWPARPPTPPQGPLASTFQLPVLYLFLDDPQLTSTGRQITARLLLLPEEAIVQDLAGRCQGRFPLPDGLDDLDLALSACPQGLTLLPSAELGLGMLHQVADRLAGSHPLARYRGRTAVLFPTHGP